MSVSVSVEKAFDQIQYPFMKKEKLGELGKEENILSTYKYM